MGRVLTTNKWLPLKLCQAKTPKWQNRNLKRSSASAAFSFRSIGSLPKDALNVLCCACFKNTLSVARCAKHTMIFFSFPSLLIKFKHYHGQKVEIAIRHVGSFILVKSDLVTFDFLMSIMRLHGFSPAP